MSVSGVRIWLKLRKKNLAMMSYFYLSIFFDEISIDNTIE